VRNYCTIGNCGIHDTIRFMLYEDFVRNYEAIVSPLDDEEDSIKLYTTASNGYSFIDQKVTGIFPTPSLQPSSLYL